MKTDTRKTIIKGIIILVFIAVSYNLFIKVMKRTSPKENVQDSTYFLTKEIKQDTACLVDSLTKR